MVSSSSWSWSAFHLYYHGDRSLLLNECVRSAVGSLASAAEIRAFFFIHYPLGGPHVRLRLLHRSASESAVNDAVETAAGEFFARRPSRDSQSPEQIRRNNLRILAGAPLESDGGAYEDNSVHRAPFVPETERYGGEELLDATHALFTLSSAQVLELLARDAGRSPARLLAGQLRLLLRQAWGLAETPDDLITLLGCRVDQGRHPEVVARADRVVAMERTSLMKLASSEIENLLDADADSTDSGLVFAEGARRLSREIGSCSPSAADWIRSSHLHMTGNRMGLSNAEESYAGRLLTRIVEDLADRGNPALWERVAEQFSRRSQLACRPWPELVELSLEPLVRRPWQPTGTQAVLSTARAASPK